MELKDYLAILWRRKWIIFLTVAVTVCIVIVGTIQATPVYSASTTLRVATTAGSSFSYSDFMYADRLMNTYIRIATSRPVLIELKKRLDLVDLPNIKVEVLANTELIQISVESPDPQLASDAANTLADILMANTSAIYTGGEKSPQEILKEQLTQIEADLNQARKDYENLVLVSPSNTERITAASRDIDQKQKTYATLLDQYEQARIKETIRANAISIIEPAIVPTVPVRPRKALNISLGAVAGLVGGLGLTFLFHHLDTTMMDPEQIEAVTGLPVIGKIPKVNKELLFSFSDGKTSFSEAFRMLRVNLFSRKFVDPLRTILITSANPSEGKSIIVANLANIIAQTGMKVIIVDCDLHVPTIHKYLNIPNEVGLSNILKQKALLENTVQRTRFQGVMALTSGPQLNNPSVWLGSPAMITLLQQLTSQFDVVLLDTPAILALADAAVLAAVVSGVILVVTRGQTHKEDVLASQKQLASVNARLIGVIENLTVLDQDYAYYRRRSN